jgi:hypothetical protein
MKRLCNNDTSRRRNILFLRFRKHGAGKVTVVSFFLFRTGDTTGVDGYDVRMAESREKNYEPRLEKEKQDCFLSPFIFLKDCM